MISNIKRELPELLKLAYPLILSQLAQFGIIFTDVVMMGLLGPEVLAGAGFGAAIFSFLLMFSTGVITIITNQVSSHMHDKIAVKQIIHSGLFISLLLFSFFGLLLWNINPILTMLGQEPSIIETVSLYLKILIWGMLFNLFYMTLRAFTIGILHPQLITTITIGAMFLNVILNFSFIYAFPSLGVMNLAIASSLVFFMMFITLTINVLCNKKLKPYGLLRDLNLFHPTLILKILRLGIPMGFIFTFESGFFIYSTFMAATFGTISLAAHHIAIHLCVLAYMVIVGISNATSVMVSQAFSQLDFNRIRTIGRAGIFLGLIWMSITSLLFILWPKPLIYLFTYFNQQEMASVFAVAVSLLVIAAALQLFDGLQGITFGILRGVEEGFKPMLIAIIGYWCIGAPFSYLLSIVWQSGVEGVWWGLATGLAATGLLGWIFFERKIAVLKAG